MHESDAGGGERTSKVVVDAEITRGSRFLPLRRTFAPGSTASYLGWGALAALGRPGIGLPLFFVVALGVLMFGVVTAKNTRIASARALLFGTAVATSIAIGAQSWGWLVPLGMTLVCLVGYFLPLALLIRWSFWRATPAYGALFVGVVWSLYSWILGALGMPLAFISQDLASSIPSLLGGARLVGAAIVEGGLTATAFAVAATVVRCRGVDVRGQLRKAARPLLVGLTALAALSGFARLSAPAADGQVRAGIVQVNAGAEYHGARLEIPAMQRAFDRQLEGLLGQLTDVELVVMPETFDGRYTLMLPALREEWSARARKWRQAYLLTSYLSQGSGLKSNAAGLIDARGTLTGVHRKVVLAPYGERGLAAGSTYRALPLADDAAVGVMICQESMSGLATRRLVETGATLLVGTSSDISFGSSLVPFEHLAATRLRGIESGRSIIWASNAGPSGVIDRWGSGVATTPFRRAVALKSMAELHREVTPYQKLHYHWLALLLLALTALGWLIRRDAPPLLDHASADASLTWRAVALPAAVLAIVLGTMPALVELRHGSSPRALAAVTDLWSGQAIVPLSRTLDRFYTTPEQSHAGAVALFLSYYGQALGQDDVPMPARPGLRGLQELLRERYQLETSILRLGEVLPETAAIVELGDGSFGVLASPTGQQGWLVAPSKHALGSLSKEQRAELSGRQALVPTGIVKP